MESFVRLSVFISFFLIFAALNLASRGTEREKVDQFCQKIRRIAVQATLEGDCKDCEGMEVFNF